MENEQDNGQLRSRLFGNKGFWPWFEQFVMVIFGLVSWAMILSYLPLAESIPIYAGY